MSWDDKKIEILKNEWGKGKTASKLLSWSGVSRNAVIGKAHDLNLSIKIKSRNTPFNNYNSKDKNTQKRTGNLSKGLGLEA